MKYNLNRNELIEAYLNNELSDANTKEFEILMEKDHRLRTEVNQFKQVFDGLKRLKEREQLRKDFKKWDAKIDRKKNPICWGYSVAAIFLVACCFYFTNHSKNSEVLFTEYYHAYPNVIHPLTRGNQPKNIEIEKMMFLYESQQYHTLIPMLEGKNENTQWDFYLGIAYLASNDSEKAITVFERINEGNNFYHQKRWYEALAFLKNDELKNCKELLKKIISNHSYQHKKASLLLEEIQ